VRSGSIRNFSHFPSSVLVPVKFFVLSAFYSGPDCFSINRTDKIKNFSGTGSVGPDSAFGSATGSAQAAQPRLRIRVFVGAARIRNVFLFISHLVLFTGNMEENKIFFLVAVQLCCSVHFSETYAGL
jgi:hypothetical protein